MMTIFILWAAIWAPTEKLGEAQASVQPIAVYMSESACVHEVDKYRARGDANGNGHYVAACTPAKVPLVKPY
jgi:hypothetical protein